MSINLEFLDKSGSEGIGLTHLHEERWMRYEWPVPVKGDVFIADFGQRFRVVERTFYFLPNAPGVKLSLHCEELPWRSAKG